MGLASNSVHTSYVSFDSHRDGSRWKKMRIEPGIDVVSLPLDSFGRSVNKYTKWGLAGLVAGIVVWRRDEAVLWAVTGAVANAGNSKLLKRWINQQRPESATGVKLDPGMPSSHAQSLGFLSTYAAAGIVEWNGANLGSLLAVLCILACASYLAHLRVSTGLHTPAQVAVGAGVGGASAVAWATIWWAALRQAVVEFTWLSPLLLGAFMLAVVGFYVFGVMDELPKHNLTFSS